MITGELCETCNGFNEGSYGVAVCICGKDMCGHCANDFLCPKCFELKESGELNAVPIYEEGELFAWSVATPKDKEFVKCQGKNL